METKPRSTKKGLAPRIRQLSIDHPELNRSQIARVVGCTSQNVSCVLDNFLGENNPKHLADFQSSKAECYDALQLRILASLSESDIAKAPLVARVTSAAILQDKAQVLRGQATAINVVALLDVVEMFKARQAGSVVNAPQIPCREE